MTDRVKLPVPAKWQPAVRAAMAHHCAASGLPADAVTVTHVAPLTWRGEDGAEIDGLSIWLIGRGRTVRLRADLATGAIEGEVAATPPTRAGEGPRAPGTGEAVA
jgi:hypothetical protein